MRKNSPNDQAWNGAPRGVWGGFYFDLRVREHHAVLTSMSR